MLRKIIKIDEEKCNGCGICVNACHEGAIGMVKGKAKLLRDDYCDGLGNCLPACPTGAISFEEREALEYNEKAVKQNIDNKNNIKHEQNGCPGMRVKMFNRTNKTSSNINKGMNEKETGQESELRQWPVQIKLVPVNAPYFNNAKLLIAADCSAYAYAGFHKDFMKGRVTIIGCPKLDNTNYSEKLTDILNNNNIKSVTVVRMEVPCCGGISEAAVKALKNCGKMIPWQIITLSSDGKIIDN